VSFFTAGEANSAPLNIAAGFEGPLRVWGKTEDKGGREAREKEGKGP